MPRIIMNVTREQKESFKEAAQKKGLTLAGWMRSELIHSAEKREVGRPKMEVPLKPCSSCEAPAEPKLFLGVEPSCKACYTKVKGEDGMERWEVWRAGEGK